MFVYHLLSLCSGTNATLLSSTVLSSVNPSIFLHDSGHHRGLSLPDPSGKRAACHVSFHIVCLHTVGFFHFAIASVSLQVLKRWLIKA